MATSQTYKAFRRTTGDLPRTIEPSTEAVPQQLGPNDVLIKIHAVSLNFRDVAMLNGRYPVEVMERGIPASDCAAEVVDIGTNVKAFGKGDHVAPIFDLNNLTGKEDDSSKALGGDVDGVLREYAVYDENVLVRLPENLTWEEASTLACAGVTAWNALNAHESGPTGRSVLLQGTGGVSMFALILCVAAGITPIITSSSDEKLESIQKLNRNIRGTNYKRNPDQAAEVMRITDGKGVDIVVNNTGVASIPADIASLRARNGVISLVGFLEGLTARWDPAVIFGLMGKSAKLKGIATGSKLDFQALNDFIEDNDISLAPLIGRVFSFEESQAAFDYLYSGKHVGKVIIRM